MQRILDPHGTWAVPRAADRPSFTGFLIWRDVEHKVSILYPREWSLEKGTETRVHAPPGAPHQATMTIQASRLPFTVEPDDLDGVRESLERGVASIGGAEIERVSADAVAALLDVEIEHTYLADAAPDVPSDAGTTPARWRRWLRVMYQRDVQYTLSAEALDGDAFDYWRPAFMSMMRMAIFADWTAEATGRSWEPHDIGVAIGDSDLADESEP